MPEAKKLADGRFECQNCLRKFTKNPKSYIEPKFCQKSCCDEFHLNGGMSLRKLKDKINQEVQRAVREACEPLERAIRQLQEWTSFHVEMEHRFPAASKTLRRIPKSSNVRDMSERGLSR